MDTTWQSLRTILQKHLDHETRTVTTEYNLVTPRLIGAQLNVMNGPRETMIRCMVATLAVLACLLNNALPSPSQGNDQSSIKILHFAQQVNDNTPHNFVI